MLTATPLDLTPFGPLLGLLGIGYWLVALLAAALALWLPKRWQVKLPLAAVVVAGFTYPIWHRVELRNQQQDGAKARLEAAMARFDERCKTAGEKITRTADNVDGVVWMKWREKISNADNFADQWKLNDPYGQDCGAEDCIGNLLRVTKGAALNPEEAKRHATGYSFVETTDPRGQRYRYTAHLEHGWTKEQVDDHKRNTGNDVPAFSNHFALARVPIENFRARYGITWDDISDREDREHWIAGGALKVVDLQTNEMLAERVGYMVDRGQGSQAGGRSPWAFARDYSCPAFRTSADGRAYFDPVSAQFAQRVLRPTTSKD
jgi:hypothetical protein